MKDKEQKAKELVDKFLNEFEVFGLKTPFNKHKYDTAKRCALIHINETFWMLEHLFMSPKESVAYQYYEELKQEIEKL